VRSKIGHICSEFGVVWLLLMLTVIGKCTPLLRSIKPALWKRGLSLRNGEPSAFDSTFRLPGKQGSFHLEIVNAHPRDQLIRFDEREHKYTYDNSPLSQSVTTVVGGYFEKFDPGAAVEVMRNGSNWPRPQYTDANGVPHSAEQIIQGWELVGELARNQGEFRDRLRF
jgi:hypothetical protein